VLESTIVSMASSMFLPEVPVTSIIELLLNNPKLAISVGLQLVMGLALGYVMSRVIKYVIAMVLVLVAGVLLNVWSLGGTTEDLIAVFSENLLAYKDVILSFLKTLGVLVVGPITLGFFLGLIVGWIKR